MNPLNAVICLTHVAILGRLAGLSNWQSDRVVQRQIDERTLRQMSHRAFISAVLLACVPSGGCAEDLPPGEAMRAGVELFAGLKSYQTASEVKQALGTKEWKVLFERRSTPKDPGPRFDELTVELTAKECDQVGILGLQFVNDRLAGSTFTPAAYNECVSKLVARGLTFPQPGRSPDWRRTWTAERDGRKFLGIADARFEDEIFNWIKRYASVPDCSIATPRILHRSAASIYLHRRLINLDRNEGRFKSLSNRVNRLIAR